jgi:carboxyl-terminal processing protease
MPSSGDNVERFAQGRWIFLMLGIFIGGFFLGTQYNVSVAQNAPAQDQLPPPNSETLFGPFWQTYNMIINAYVDPEGDPIEAEALIAGAIEGMIATLDDPFSGYMDAETFNRSNQALSGEIEGIGATLRTLEDGTIMIANVLRSTPAEAAGVQVGDIFYQVDGVDVRGLSQEELGNLVRGPSGTVVNIIFLRDGAEVSFSITRARITVSRIDYRVLDADQDGAENDADDVAYLALFEFSANVRPQIDAALNEMDVNNRAGLIFDMRGNPGGLLQSSLEVGTLFTEAGATLVIEDFGTRQENLTTVGDPYGLTVPLVILVNGRSASGSELVAGAWQDLDVGVVIGETTFGKGTVQNWRQLADGSGLRLTVARWLTPDGNWIHERGVTPDLIIPWEPTFEDYAQVGRDPHVDAALEYLATGELPEPPPVPTPDMSEVPLQ